MSRRAVFVIAQVKAEDKDSDSRTCLSHIPSLNYTQLIMRIARSDLESSLIGSKSAIFDVLVMP